jgi:hypothetical protein
LKFISFFLSIFLSFSVYATNFQDIQALRTEEPSLLNSYLDLMQSKKLIDQASAKLKKRQLLKRDGGLCAFTAETDAIAAVSNYYKLMTKKFVDRPDYFLYQVIDEARGFMDADPTHDGIDLPELKEYTEDVLEQYGLNEIIRLRLITNNEQINPEKFRTQYWKLRLLGMISNDKTEGHTIVMLGVNTDEKIIYTSDPNYPNKVIKNPYKYDHGRFKIYLSDDFGKDFQPAFVDEILEVNIPRD